MPREQLMMYICSYYLLLAAFSHFTSEYDGAQMHFFLLLVIMLNVFLESGNNFSFTRVM